ncbi:MAG: hypothetical protein IPK97_01105 [Ahniella sp.]|nr:hypothetical protein [Ahniella sp.]
MYDSIKNIHAFIGALALITFWWAGLARKGTSLHRWVGRTYLIAMCGILATGFPMAYLSVQSGRVFIGTFLAYLLLITATAMWQSWRAIRDKQDFARFTGPVHRILMVLNGLAGLGVLWLGVSIGNTLFAGFSMIAIVTAWRMFMTARRGPQHTLWWREAHMDSMLGNAVATHIAFLSIGLPKILPMLSGPAQQNLAWFGPLVLAVVARHFLRKKFPDGRPLQQTPTTPAVAVST